ncbi:MAG: AmmeMemoRadiSam system protein B [Thermodesulfobacteriota bacterium]
MHRTCWPILFVIAIFLFCPASGGAADGGNVRRAVMAGRFYPGDPQQLEQMIHRFTERARKTELDLPENRTLKALIMPHAGYVYSGWTAAHAVIPLKGRDYDKVVVMAPDHRVGLKNGAISDVDAYATPLGRIDLHPEAKRLRKRFSCFESNAASDDREHAVEVVLPFLQQALPEFELIPIVMGSGDADQYIDAVETVMGDDTLLVVSTDLSHYLPYSKAVKQDRQTIEQIEQLDPDFLKKGRNRACGHTPLRVVIELAEQGNWQPVVLDYCNSGDTAGKRDKVVGYTTIAFYGEKTMANENSSQQFDEEKGRVLVELARKTIASRLGEKHESSVNLHDTVQADKDFQRPRGTFVTLKKADELRGCIGNLNPDKPLAEGVKDNALNAAFHDPRFPPLSKEELEKVRIEVSLLTEPAPLDYKGGEDLLAKLTPNVDGVIIRKGSHSATFLPQVWEQLPDKESFLQHLCLKAGLPANEWQNGNLTVYTYRVQYFEEQKH